MDDIDKLFFELIQVALGCRVYLSHSPTSEEWKTLFDMAKKQSLVGVCFAGLQRLGADADEGFARIGISEMLYLTWMGMAAKIQQKNEIVNRQCLELQRKLSADGFRSSILKGQGIASLYEEKLRGLRQSGDIDVYVDCGMETALAFVREKFGDVEYDYINAHVPVFRETEVELHWRAQVLTNVFANRRLQEWLKEHQEMLFGGKARLGIRGARLEVRDERLEVVTPSAEFNAFYILLHCYHHMFESGLGLRQLMDYYFVLLSLECECSQINRKLDVNALFEEFCMKRFATGVMWIMKEVFGLSEELLLCEAEESEGQFLLTEVMQNGNFGHHDKRIKKVGSGKMSELWRNVQHNWHLASHYPAEMVWQPVWLAYHFCWKRFGKH